MLSCANSPCSHICAIIEEEIRCFCPVGFELDTTTSTTCEGERSYLIAKSYNFNEVLFFNEDIDECGLFSPCDQLCTNTMGSFMCSCNSGYVLQNSQTCEG